MFYQKVSVYVIIGGHSLILIVYTLWKTIKKKIPDHRRAFLFRSEFKSRKNIIQNHQHNSSVGTQIF